MLLQQQPITAGNGKVAVPTALLEAITDASPHLLARLYDPDAPAGVYMLVDGSLWRDVAGIFDLDAIDLPAQCLFEGKAAEESGETAPWLVDMSIPEPGEAGSLSFYLRAALAGRHQPADPDGCLVYCGATASATVHATAGAG